LFIDSSHFVYLTKSFYILFILLTRIIYLLIRRILFIDSSPFIYWPVILFIDYSCQSVWQRPSEHGWATTATHQQKHSPELFCRWLWNQVIQFSDLSHCIYWLKSYYLLTQVVRFIDWSYSIYWRELFNLLTGVIRFIDLRHYIDWSLTIYWLESFDLLTGVIRFIDWSHSIY